MPFQRRLSSAESACRSAKTSLHSERCLSIERCVLGATNRLEPKNTRALLLAIAGVICQWLVGRSRTQRPAHTRHRLHPTQPYPSWALWQELPSKRAVELAQD